MFRRVLLLSCYSMEWQSLYIGKAKLLEAEFEAIFSLFHLLCCHGYYYVRVDPLFPFLHNLELDINDLNDSIIDHMVIKVELLVQIVLLF